MLNKFLKRDQNEFDAKVKKIRSDNGSEFKNTKVEDYLDQGGIKHKFLALYTPEQNGINLLQIKMLLLPKNMIKIKKVNKMKMMIKIKTWAMIKEELSKMKMIKRSQNHHHSLIKS
jgi:hypothetical protein